MWSDIFESQRVGERPYVPTTQPALLLAKINFKLKTFHMGEKTATKWIEAKSDKIKKQNSKNKTEEKSTPRYKE